MRQLVVNENQPLVDDNFKFEWRIDGAEVSEEDEGEGEGDISELIQVEELQGVALLDVDEENTTNEQEEHELVVEIGLTKLS